MILQRFNYSVRLLRAVAYQEGAMSDSFVQTVQSEEHFDVVVIGGGTTGVCAALAAAKAGAKTAIIEYYGFLGGNAGTGIPWMAFHNYHKRQLVVKGIPLEIIERLRVVGGASEFLFDPILSSTIQVNSTWLKVILADMMEESGVTCFLHSLATGVEKDGTGLRSVIIQNKQGCQRLYAKAFVDCTDTGDIAVMAGADFEFGRRKDGKLQVASYIHIIGDIDMEAFIGYLEKHPDQMRPHKFPEKDMQELLGRLRTTSLFSLGAFRDLTAQAKRDGVDFDRDFLVGIAYPKNRELMLVTSRVENVDANNVANFSQSEMTGVRQIKSIMEFVKKYVPGGQNARLVTSGHQIGIRESRHIIGDYYLTGEDLMRGKHFEDAIALGAYHLDIHTPDHKGLAPLKQPPTYQIPYRCLLPKKVEGLLVAGRCISADHAAESSTRVIPISGAQGQAAGAAAAIAAISNRPVRQIDVKRLQHLLIEQGAEIGQTLEQSVIP